MCAGRKWEVLSKRDERSKLIDNIGRQIRRLNAREKSGTLDEFQQRGLERQRENLKELRDKVKSLSKTDTEGIKKAKEDYKNNGNYSSSQKKIDEITRRIIATQPTELEELEEPPELEPGGESYEDGDGESPATPLYDPRYEGLFEDLANLDGVYIGKYMSEDARDRVNQALDKIKDITKTEDKEMTAEERQILLEIADSLESKMYLKGNESIRDESGKVIGYQATWNHDENEKYMNKLGSAVKFDVERWIMENIELFNQPAPHRGSLSADEKWEKQNAGILNGYDF